MALTGTDLPSVDDLSYHQSKQFALNFPIIMESVSTYMKAEYNEGRLKDQNYATVQAQAIQSGIQATLQLTMNSDSQKNQADLVEAQKAMVVAQTLEIAPNASKQRAAQDAQILQVTAEEQYTIAKKQVMIDSRIDNLIIEDGKMQMQQLATVGAGGLVPSINDFLAGNSIRDAIYRRAKGEALPAITFIAGTNYTKAT